MKKLGTLKPRVTRSANLEAAGSNFTADSVALLLQTLFPSAPPLPLALQQIFAGRMNVIRAKVRTAHELFRASHAEALAAQNAIPVVIGSLKKQRIRVADAVERYQCATSAELQFNAGSITHTNLLEQLVQYQEALAAGDRVISDLELIQNSNAWFVRVEDSPKFPDNWTDYFSEIVAASKDVAATLKVGTGKTRGKYTKLLAALIKRTTGQTVAIETIYDHMKAIGG